MDKYSNLIRTTIGEFMSKQRDDIQCGIYVVACYPQFGCIYVGRSRANVQRRMYGHFVNDKEYQLGAFLRSFMPDACGFRLDILVPPVDADADRWMYDAERELIQSFRPILNTQLVSSRHVVV